ncbi:zinc ribbon domain-containing protein [Catenulispora pinisilvae]|uniref:zinc ribbon domain-containing protein n=1 Tax=Catenulispora pinisilvae TaxID=2705253 RepID=UPI001E308F89|nr:C4-type zinc ribbon domain-containing protein [Catenulispora pinisilvae]
MQGLDTRLAQLEHKRRTLPELAEAEKVDQRLADLRDVLVAAQTAEGDVAREQKKAEADVEQVVNRAVRDRQMLQSGRGSAKDLENIQHELQTLAKRQSDLEDVVLEVMERRETAQNRVTEMTVQRDEAQTRRDEVAAAIAEATGAVDRDVAAVTAERATIAGVLPEDLLALYERIRAAEFGVGAAALRRRRCEGCQLELDISEVNAIKAKPADEVVRHEACGRILVRVPDSGL